MRLLAGEAHGEGAALDLDADTARALLAGVVREARDERDALAELLAGALAALHGVADHLDEHSYSELSCYLDDDRMREPFLDVGLVTVASEMRDRRDAQVKAQALDAAADELHRDSGRVIDVLLGGPSFVRSWLRGLAAGYREQAK